MPNEHHDIVGEVELGDSTRLVFSLSTYQGRRYAHVRKFVTTNRYTGPAKAGIALTGEPLAKLVEVLKQLAANVPPAGELHVASIPKSKGSEYRVGLVPADADSPLPRVDIREYVTTASYTGFTRKGIRFGWDKLGEVVRLLEVQLVALGKAVTSEPTLFSDFQPEWTKPDSTTIKPPKKSELGELLGPLPAFPHDFLPAAATLGQPVALPSDPLQLHHERDGSWHVITISGFRWRVRNQVEGRFLLYAQHRGAASVTLPTAMLHVFQTVAAYEKHCRELRQKLIRQLEARCHNRPLAEFQTRQLFQKHGLPLVDF